MSSLGTLFVLNPHIFSYINKEEDKDDEERICLDVDVFRICWSINMISTSILISSKLMITIGPKSEKN